MDKIKILMVASGKSYHATRWANALVKENLEVYFYTNHKFLRPLDEKIILLKGKVKNKIGYILNILDLIKTVKIINPHIVHVHSAGGYGFMGSFIKKFKILSLYGSDIFISPNKSIINKMILKYQLKKYPLIQSTSQSMSLEAKKYTTSKINIIAFGVDTDLFIYKQNKIIDNTIRIGIVKKLEKIYGIDILINAFKKITNVNNIIELYIVGDGTQKSNLRILASDNKHIYFKDAIPNKMVPSFLSTLDIFVVPSRSESFGVAAIEASSCSLPVIASNVGGLPEVVINNKTGLLFEKEDIKGLTQKLNILIEDSTLRKSLGFNGRNFIEKTYNWKQSIKEQINIYKKIIDVNEN
jgi:L-malate glycosyltransferase